MSPELTCPACELPVHEDVSDDEIEIRYKRRGKPLEYTHGWHACPRCLVGAIKCLDQYMQVQRINRGISLRAIRAQEQKSKDSGCGCGG